MEYQQAQETNVYHPLARDQRERLKKSVSSGAPSSPGRRVRYHDEAVAQRRLVNTMMKQQEFITRLRSLSAQEVLENQHARRSVPPSTIVSAGKDENEQEPNNSSSNHSVVSSMGDTYGGDRETAPRNSNTPFVETVKDKVTAQIKALPAFFANLAESTTAPTWMDCRNNAMDTSTSNCSPTKVFSDEGPCQGPIPSCAGAEEVFQGKSITDDPVLDATGGVKGTTTGENADNDSLLDIIDTAEVSDDEGGNGDNEKAENALQCERNPTVLRVVGIASS